MSRSLKKSERQFIDRNDPELVEFERSRRIASKDDRDTKGDVDKLFNILAQNNSGLFAGVSEAATMQKTASKHQIKPEEDQGPQNQISRNQWNAITKYPELIEMLGKQDIGEKIADAIMGDVKKILTVQIEKNSQTYNNYAQVCVAERQNLKQFFKGDNWVCCVIATGPFRGDEIIHYKKEADKSFILRKIGEKEFEDVSVQFNLIHTLADNIETEEESDTDIPLLADD